MKRIYLDHAATTPLHPKVLESMLPVLQGSIGNPSSLHHFGRSSRSLVEDARRKLAVLLGCHSHELIFTASGTESNNMALFGAAYGTAQKNTTKKHIITSKIEHHSVLYACEQLEREGFEITFIPVDTTGRIQMEKFSEAIRPETCLVSLMYANNEVGTIQPIVELGHVLRQKGVLFHVDAVQALGSIPIDLDSLPVDMMSFSAHKINGPLGVGAFYLSQQVREWVPLIYGGAQERSRRAGTENVTGIIGFAQAYELSKNNFVDTQLFNQNLRIKMIKTLRSELGDLGFALIEHPTEQLPHILNISFPGVDTETMLMNLDLEGIAAASGSACSSGSHKVSHVLKAMQLPDEWTRSAIRFSFGLNNTMEEIEAAALIVAKIVQRIRSRHG